MKRTPLSAVALALVAVIAGCTVGYAGDAGDIDDVGDTPGRSTLTPEAGGSLVDAEPGPTATPTPGPRPTLTVHLVNAGGEPYDVRAVVFEGPVERARVRGSNGTSTVGNLTRPTGVQLFAPEGATGVEPLSSAATLGEGSVSVPPGENGRIAFESVPHGAGVFVLVTDSEGRVFEWVVATCASGFEHNSLTLELGTWPRAGLNCEFASGF